MGKKKPETALEQPSEPTLESDRLVRVHVEEVAKSMLGKNITLMWGETGYKKLHSLRIMLYPGMSIDLIDVPGYDRMIQILVALYSKVRSSVLAELSAMQEKRDKKAGAGGLIKVDLRDIAASDVVGQVEVKLPGKLEG